MVEAVPIVLQWPGEGAEEATSSMNSLASISPARHHLARLPHDRSRARALAVEPAVQHRPAGEHDRRDVDGGGGHQLRGRGLVAAGGQHDAVDRVAVEDLDQARGRRGCGRATPSGACTSPGSGGSGTRRRCRRPRGCPRGRGCASIRWCRLQGERSEPDCAMPMIGLPDWQLLERQAVVHVALEVERGHVGVVGVVEPLRASAAS